jgi:hypothetical protein
VDTAGFGTDRRGAAFFVFALGAAATFFGAAFFPGGRFADAFFFAAGLRAFGFVVFFAAIEPLPINASTIVREMPRVAKHHGAM